jgi:outer membrane protein assembly factor BamB
LADWGLLFVLVAVPLSQLVIWNFWDPAFGVSLKNLITYSQIALIVLCGLGWWFLFAPVSLRLRLLAGLPVLALIGGWIASIRRAEFSGDMVLTFQYRWQPTPEQALAAHRSSLPASTEPVAAGREIPIAGPEDLPAYRGAGRDGVVVGPPLNQDWQASPPRELWRHPVGGGYSSFSIVGHNAITLEQRGPDEAIVCYDADTGRELWEHHYPAAFDEAMGGPGPRSTPTIAGDAVYAFGAFGDLCCVDLITGQLRWHVNALQQFQVPNTDWAMTCSPLVIDGHVIVNIGGAEGDGLIAYQAADGSLVWHSGGLSDPAPVSQFQTGSAAAPKGKASVPGYAAPVLVTLLGERQILNLDGMGVRGHNPQTGAQLWFGPFENSPHVNVAQPILFEDGRVFLSSSYDVGCKMIQVSREGDEWSAKDLWSNINLRCKFTSPVLYEGYLYGLDEGVMVCLDPADGKRVWKGGKTGQRGRYGHGQILLTNGQILVLTENGQAALVQASPKGLEEITSMRVLPEGKNWNCPALVRGKLFVRNAAEAACFDLNVAK